MVGAGLIWLIPTCAWACPECQLEGKVFSVMSRVVGPVFLMTALLAPLIDSWLLRIKFKGPKNRRIYFKITYGLSLLIISPALYCTIVGTGGDPVLASMIVVGGLLCLRLLCLVWLRATKQTKRKNYILLPLWAAPVVLCVGVLHAVLLVLRQTLVVT